MKIKFQSVLRAGIVTRLVTLWTGLFPGVLMASAAVADVQSPWVDGMSSRTRLVAGAIARADGSRELIAGVEVALPQGWKTYWRSPGDDGGIPPEFDFSRSRNVKLVKVLYPAPRRFTDKSGDVIGYDSDVVFPVEITPINPAAPVALALTANYGVCKNICVPVEAVASLDLPLDLSAPGPVLTAALDQVPKPEGKGMQVTLWQAHLQGAAPGIAIEITGGGASTDAFLETADGSFVPQAQIISRAGDVTRLRVDLTQGANVAALTGKPLRLTIVGDQGAVEIEKLLE